MCHTSRHYMQTRQTGQYGSKKSGWETMLPPTQTAVTGLRSASELTHSQTGEPDRTCYTEPTAEFGRLAIASKHRENDPKNTHLLRDP